ncbi:hypothetical protein P692DRAFT_20882247 [Suillus brevipes Sb2]|nr:hypothetical protein P692DRAFT_20882247 [Suillus brevipes Sb2]
MAPKKSKAKKADDDGASVLHLNKGPIEAIAPKNDPAKETQRLDTLVAKCKVGVAWIDLLAMKRRLKFGVYNDRPQNEAEVNKLVACFQESGIVSMKDVTAIPLIMKTSRIDNKDSLVKNFDDPDVVPELELDIEDIDNIIVASGQHRLAALEKYNYSLKEQYQKHVSKRKKVEVLKNINQEHVATFNEAHQAMCELKGAMEDVGKWGVVIYDEDKLLADGTTLATHLSRNSTLHEFKQTEEEVLITIFKEIQQVYDTSPAKKQNDIALECLRTLRTAQEKNARLSKVLQHETYCVFFATRVMRLGPHFRHRREFKVNWLAKAIDTNMGLYLSWIQMRIKTLKRLSSKGPFPSYAEVLKLIDDADANVATAKEKLAELRTTLEKRPKTKEKGDVMIWAGVLQTIDKKASTVFTDVEDKVGEMTGAYVTPLSVYRQSAIKSLRDAWGLTSNDEWEENEILAHLDRVCARVLLHLTVETGKARAPEPLLGAFVMDNAWSALNNVKEGVKEVCRWFDALLDYHKGLHPKTHIMDDWSTVMLNNISKDARFTDGGKTYAQEVTTILWTHRRTLLVRLSNCMTLAKQNIPARAKERKELLHEYDVLPEEERFANESLMKILMSRRTKANKSRDLLAEPPSIMGTIALHSTGWDWLSPTHRNTARDLEPCVKAIAVERKYVMRYRPKLFEDKYVATLRRLLEDSLQPGVRKIQHIDLARQVTTVHAWLWWDEIPLPTTHEAPAVVLQGLEDSLVKEQSQMRERLALEHEDRVALTKMIAYLTSMPLALSSSDATAMLSADIATPLEALITGFEVNAARLRARKLSKEPKMPIDLRTMNYELRLEIPPAHNDEYTTGYVIGDEEEEDEAEPEEHPAPKQKKKTKKGKGRQPTPVPEEEEEEPAPKKKARKGKARAVEEDDEDIVIPGPETMQPSSSQRSQSEVVEVSPGSKAMVPGSRAASQPANASSDKPKPKPKPRPVPRKIHRQPSPPALDDDIQIIEKQSTAGDKGNEGAGANVEESTSADESVRPAVQAGDPSSDGHGNNELEKDAETDTVPSRTPPRARQPSPSHSPLHGGDTTLLGFSTTETGWFDPERDTDHEMDTTVQTTVVDADKGTRPSDDDTIPAVTDTHVSKSLTPLSALSDDDDARMHDMTLTESLAQVPDSTVTKSLTQVPEMAPTPPLTQVSPPVQTNTKERRVAPPTGKRERAPTASSTASSNQGRGRKPKKKAKVVPADTDEDDPQENDGEVTVVPGV